MKTPYLKDVKVIKKDSDSDCFYFSLWEGEDQYRSPVFGERHTRFPTGYSGLTKGGLHKKKKRFIETVIKDILEKKTLTPS